MGWAIKPINKCTLTSYTEGRCLVDESFSLHGDLYCCCKKFHLINVCLLCNVKEIGPLPINYWKSYQSSFVKRITFCPGSRAKIWAVLVWFFWKWYTMLWKGWGYIVKTQDMQDWHSRTVPTKVHNNICLCSCEQSTPVCFETLPLILM